MTQTNDPPTVLDIGLIPNSNEKADLNAPSDSGGKLLTNQAPNITITETAVVADAEERLALDVQEGDIAIQTNVSSSFIFTGGDNVANNWQTIDFDAVGAIDGETISPANLNISGSINGADASAAVAGQALTSDGSGSFTFESVGGDLLSLASDFLSPSNIEQVASSQSDMQEVIDVGLFANIAAVPTALSEVINSPTAMQVVAASSSSMRLVAASETAMQEVIATQTALDEVVNSQTAMQEVALSTQAFNQIAGSTTAINEIESSNVAIDVLNSLANSFTDTDTNTNSTTYKQVEPLTDQNGVWVKTATTTTISGAGAPAHRLNVRGGGDRETTTDKFVFDVEHTGNNIGSVSQDPTTSGEAYRP